MRLFVHSLVIAVLVFLASHVHTQELPTVLVCSPNANAERSFGFDENAWMGDLLGKPDASKPFNIGTRSDGKNIRFRDFSFSRLNTP
jgi:hypothetical protein